MARQQYKLTASQRKLRRITRRAITFAIISFIAAGLIVADRQGYFGQARQGDLERYDGKTFYVAHVVDGDTLDIEIADEVNSKHRTRLRLWGVDTPETVKPNCPVQHFGPEASSFTKTQTLGKNVRLVLLPNRTRDKYGRVLAYVYLPDGKMLNLELIAQGFGYADPRFEHPHKADFATAMKIARNKKIGLWKKSNNSDFPNYLKKKDKSKR